MSDEPERTDRKLAERTLFFFCAIPALVFIAFVVAVSVFVGYCYVTTHGPDWLIDPDIKFVFGGLSFLALVADVVLFAIGIDKTINLGYALYPEVNASDEEQRDIEP